MIKKNSLSLAILSILYLFTRGQNLTSIPVFGDEAIYVRWSQIIRSVETLRFIPQTDGKQPLFMWLVVPFLKLFNDPLIAGRLVSVLAGLGIIFCIYLIFVLIFKISPLKSFLLSLIYLCLPFSFFFDRLAVPDNLLSFFGALSLLLSLLQAQKTRLDLSLILGGVLGLAWLTKSPAIYFIALSFLTFIFYNYRQPKRIIFPIISSILSLVIYNILRLGPQFNQIAIRNLDYVWSVSDIIKHPLDPLMPHISDTITLAIRYLSWPVLVLFTLGLFKINKNKNVWIIFAWGLLPLIANCAFAKVFTARYILFTLPPIFIGFGYLISRLSIKILLLTPLIIFSNLFFIYQLSFKPFQTVLPATETGYLRDWTSGWGIKSAADYLIIRSKSENVIVGTEGAFGTLPDGLQIYTNNVSHLTVFGVGLGFEKIPEKLFIALKAGDEVYLLANNSRLKLNSDQNQHLVLISKTPKPDGDSLLLYRLQ